jgi:thiamine-phosphate pyrophosphorylase
VSAKFIEALAGTHLYPITHQQISGLTHAEQVGLLSESGAKLIQLREKIDSPLEFFTQAEAALRIARERDVKIIINDRVDIALALRADGVHLGQEDLPPGAARRILGDDVIIGFSTHNLEQARLAQEMPVDYVAVGPIFASDTKRSSNPPVGLDRLARIREALGEMPLVAIGGITAENLGSVLLAGADAVAVIRDIWAPDADMLTKTRRLLSISQT